MSRGSLINEEDLPPTLRKHRDDGWIHIPMGTSMEDAQKIIIRQTVSAQKGNQSKAAEVLGIGRKSLHQKLSDFAE
jgi:transcriptional regulator of acetoin/glycerol metabolism